jgi:hypothetical protein
MKNREEWLLKATSLLRPVFRKHGMTIPRKIMVGCGWPKGGKVEVIGQCFGKTWTTDETVHIFISPTQDDPINVLAILVHELVHAAVGVEEGHRGRFKEGARALGLEGKLTHTYVTEQSELFPVLKKISRILGKYPHSKMIKNAKNTKPKYVWPRLISRTIPTYTFVISPRLLEAFGLPLDPKGEKMIKIARGDYAKSY